MLDFTVVSLISNALGSIVIGFILIIFMFRESKKLDLVYESGLSSIDQKVESNKSLRRVVSIATLVLILFIFFQYLPNILRYYQIFA